MGSVYEAIDTQNGARVAVKVITAEAAASETLMSRFAREAEAAAAIDTPHIVRVFGAGRDEERRLPFLVMEYLEGEDLHQMSFQTAGEMGLAISGLLVGDMTIHESMLQPLDPSLRAWVAPLVTASLDDAPAPRRSFISSVAETRTVVTANGARSAAGVEPPLAPASFPSGAPAGGTITSGGAFPTRTATTSTRSRARPTRRRSRRPPRPSAGSRPRSLSSTSSPIRPAPRSTSIARTSDRAGSRRGRSLSRPAATG
jgi:hypothetical protein